MNPLTGVCPVLEVPFDDAEAVDYDSFSRVVAHVAASGARGMMFPGFASEYYKLSDQERVELLRIMISGAGHTSEIVTIASIPDHTTHLAVARAREAVELGAGAINLLPPHFLKPPERSQLEHVDAVLTAVAPRPVMVQYAPDQTGATIGIGSLSVLAEMHSNLVAVKVESSPPGPPIAELKAARKSLPALVGNAGVHLPDALRHGAVGVQPGCSLVEVYVGIWDAWERGDQVSALLLHRRLLPFLTYWTQSIELIVAAEKYISWRRGLIDTWFCRRPDHVLDDEEMLMVDAVLEEFSGLLPPLGSAKPILSAQSGA